METSAGRSVNKACDSCHTFKVRCIRDTSTVAGPCQRCIRTSRSCVFSAPQRRKQRKRTDTRVAELEQEMRALRSIIRGGGSERVGMDPLTGDGVQAQHNPVESVGQHTSVASSTDHPTPMSQNTTKMDSSPVNDAQDVDVVGRGLVTMALTETLYKTYVYDLLPQYPAVTFPNSYTAEDLRNDRPVLFLAVITAASSKTDPVLFGILSKEILKVYATRTFINYEKSLELVQSMLISVIWYHPPDRFSRLKFYENIHMAAVMALEIGLGSDPATSKSRFQDEQNSPTRDIDTTDVDKKRAILTCYLACSGVSLSVRRPNMLRFNSWMSDCTKFLKESPDATIFDKNLVARVSLQNIAEDISTFLSIEDPSKKTTFLDSRTQLTIRSFEKRLASWKENLDPELTNATSMMMMYHYFSILLYEVALYVDHPPEEFVPPYTLYKSEVKHSRNEKPTEHYIDAIIACVKSGHNLLDAFLTIDAEKLRAAPVIVFVVVCYTSVVLAKLNISARDPQSELGAFVDVDSLALDDYSCKVISHMAKAAGSEGFRIPQIFLGVLQGLRKWNNNHSSSEKGDDEMIRPLMHLNLMSNFESPANISSSATTSSMETPIQGLHILNEPRNVAESRTDIYTTAANNSLSSSVPENTRNNYDASENRIFSEPGHQFVSNRLPNKTSAQVTHEYDFGDQMDTDLTFFDIVDTFSGDMSTWLGVSGDQRPNVYDNGYNNNSAV